MLTTRQQVYGALDSERFYQEYRWRGHKHSLTEYVVYMEDYLAELKHLASRRDESEVAKELSDIMRKVTALGVASLEEHGVNRRAGW